MSCRSSVIPIWILIMTTALFLPGFWASKDALGLTPSMILESTEIKALVRDHYAVTEFISTVSNPSDGMQEVLLSFQVPGNGMLSNLSLTMDGRTTFAHVIAKEAAAEIYDAAKAQGESAVHLTNPGGKGLFQISVNIAGGKDAVITLRYEQVIMKVLGEYIYSMDIGSLKGPGTFAELSASLWVRGVGPILEHDLSESTVDVTSNRYDSRSINISFSSKPAVPGTITLSFTEAAPPLNGTMLTYKNGNEAYFMHVFSPGLEGLGGSQLPKDIVFVLDHSGSMTGEKITQLKDAFSEIVQQLYDEDMFNIIIFNDWVKEYMEEMVIASHENRRDATTYIQDIYADGSTNIDEALKTALRMYVDRSESVPVIVFLTDGLPTAGVTATSEIRKNVIGSNELGASIYTIGFGSDVDYNFLKALSLENKGFSTLIPSGKDAGTLLRDFYQGISTPLLKDIQFQYTAGASRVIPETAPGLYEGSELVVSGMFEGSFSSITSHVKAVSSIGPLTFDEEHPVLPDEGTELVGRLWAHRRIAQLLDSITVIGEQRELVEQIKELGIKFGFATPYTSFILVVDRNPEKEDEPTEPISPYGDMGDNGWFPTDTDSGDDDSVDYGPVPDGEGGACLSFLPISLAPLLIGTIIALVVFIVVKRFVYYKKR